jgi:hypothetical protein
MKTLPDIEQIIYALERQERALRAHADKLARQLDYSAEFPAEDADRMLEAIELLQRKEKASAEPTHGSRKRHEHVPTLP